MCSLCVKVCIYEWRLKDRLWLDWCPSPDESEILMCQQGWIMHTPPLPLFSSSLVFSRSLRFSSQLPHLKTSLSLFSPHPSSSPSLCKRGHNFPLAVLRTALLSASTDKLVLLLNVKFCPSELSAWHRMTTDALSELFLMWHLHWKWLNVLMYTARYPIMVGRSALTLFDSYIPDWQESLGG